MFELVVEKTFAAAHYLRNFSGPCERLHGHNYRVQVYLRGTRLNDAGMLVDFTDIKAALGAILDRFDHQCLNDLPEFEAVSPSAENIARMIGEAIGRRTWGEADSDAHVDRVRVWETPIQSATYFLV
jgi:6-pyruvoyltetrahydropterin/6-carboxytetrahydropterin synthase